MGLKAMKPVYLTLFLMAIYISGANAQSDTIASAPTVCPDSLTADKTLVTDKVPLRKRSIVFKTYQPHISMFSFKPVLRNQYAPFGRKFVRATGLVFASEALEMFGLFMYRSDFSNWNHSELWEFKKHYHNAYTLPPVIDKDDFIGNFVEHPYQGTLDYNALRSQGARPWQAALFVTLHSTLFEYVIEACEERPSIQDLIVTPLGGMIFGEMIHCVTMEMSKNGFKWYEAITVTILNPMFVINNGFRFANPKRYPGYINLE